MKNNHFRDAVFLTAGLALVGACNGPDRSSWGKVEESLAKGHTVKKSPLDGAQKKSDVALPTPPLSEDIFPCTGCHDADDEVNATKRKLEEEHESIKFKHGGPKQWCYDCHNPNDRDKLRLASGALIDFNQAHLLCGQCHGSILRDWQVGIHGKRTGSWSGKKVYRLCVSCHNPHSPRFKPLKPKPRPRRPSEIRAPQNSESSKVTSK